MVAAAHVLPWSGAVEGLARGAEGTLLGATIQESAAQAVARAGLASAASGELLLIQGGVALGPRALSAALEAGRAHGGPCRLVLGGAIGELLRALPGAGPALAYLPDVEDLPAALPEQSPLVEIPPEERLLPLDLPSSAEGIPLSDRLIVPIRHWLDLLWANLLGLPAALWGALLGRPLPVAAARLAWAAARAGSVTPERVAAKLVTRGAGCRVHPSAVVEACVLGPGAQIGAGAVVRGCLLGAGARVEAQALCEGVVLGPGAVVQRQAMVKYSVLGAEAMLGGVTQLSVLGREAQLKSGAFGMDQSLEGAVRVLSGGQLVEAPLGLAGVCLGERAIIGCGVRVAPGRAVPSGAKVVAAGALVRPSALSADGPSVVGGADAVG